MAVKLILAKDRPGNWLAVNHRAIREMVRAPDNLKAARNARELLDAELRLGELALASVGAQPHAPTSTTLLLPREAVDSSLAKRIPAASPRSAMARSSAAAAARTEPAPRLPATPSTV